MACSACSWCKPPARGAAAGHGTDWDLASEASSEEFQSEVEEDIREHKYEWDSLWFPPGFFGCDAFAVDSDDESGDEGAPPIDVILGAWKCVDTWGLEEFLKATGVGMMQRKIATAAAWPSWEFEKLPGGGIHFVNHAAIGVIKEEMLLGKDYQWKDGQNNLLNCRTEWKAGPGGGGKLQTSRSGALGSFVEERCVSGDKLTFTLKHKTGVTWGRAFVRN